MDYIPFTLATREKTMDASFHENNVADAVQAFTTLGKKVLAEGYVPTFEDGQALDAAYQELQEAHAAQARFNEEQAAKNDAFIALNYTGCDKSPPPTE